MFFMLALNRTSNASPTTGIAPIVVSRKAFASIRAISPSRSRVGAGSTEANESASFHAFEMSVEAGWPCVREYSWHRIERGSEGLDWILFPGGEPPGVRVRLVDFEGA